MKRIVLLTAIVLAIVAAVVTQQITMIGQPLASADNSLESRLVFSNHPIDHRYRLILDNKTESSIMAIAEKSRMEKKHLLLMLTEVAQKYNLEPALVMAVATQESMLDPNARSHVGAMGLMQLMPATARRFGVKNILDPRQNAEGGARYIRYLLNQFKGNEELALAAYNAGSAPVLRYKAIPPYEQTQTFVKRVLRLREHYRQVL
jgi:hypothetical protein